jgi:hypothetical protein
MQRWDGNEKWMTGREFHNLGSASWRKKGHGWEDDERKVREDQDACAVSG